LSSSFTKTQYSQRGTQTYPEPAEMLFVISLLAQTQGFGGANRHHKVTVWK